MYFDRKVSEKIMDMNDVAELTGVSWIFVYITKSFGRARIWYCARGGWICLTVGIDYDACRCLLRLQIMFTRITSRKDSLGFPKSSSEREKANNITNNVQPA